MEEKTIVEEKPIKKSNAALILGIIGTATGVLALLIIVFGLFFGGIRHNMMENNRDNNTRVIEIRTNHFNRGIRR